MDGVDFDPRYLTGPTTLVLGAVFLWIALRLWLVHPINRVFRIAPFVTERGLRAVLAMRPLFLAYGLFFASSGTASIWFWFVSGAHTFDPVVRFFGSLAAGFAVCAVVVTVIALTQLLRIGR